jgi:hypothetical protein
MDRRRFLAGLAAGLAASGTGCSGSDRGGAAATATPTAGDGTAFDGPRDVALPLDESDLVRAAGRDEIPAIGDTNPYGDYETYQPPDPSRDGSGRRLPAKELVLGVATDGTARAYPFRSVVEAGGVVNDRVGGLPVVVASTHDSLVAYVRRAGGDVLLFGRDGDALVAGGSRWAVVSGRALDGPTRGEGAGMERANDRSPMFWFAWVDFFPGTDVYGESG